MSHEDPQWESRVLWDARENLEMWADVVDAKHGYVEGQRQPSHQVRELIKQIDTWRRNKGYPTDGFGGEGE